MIIPMLCVTIFVILVVWFLLPRVARLMIHTPTAISIFVCLSTVELTGVFISMRGAVGGRGRQVSFARRWGVGLGTCATSVPSEVPGLAGALCPAPGAARDHG